MKFLSVATFCWPDHYGGAERVIGELGPRLVARGHSVVQLTARLPGTEERGHHDGVTVLRYPVDRRSPARFYRSVFAGVRALLRQPASAGADVLHVHQLVSGLAAVTPGGARRLPVLQSFYAPYHEEYLARHRGGRDDGEAPAGARTVAALLRRGDRYLLGRARRIVALSRFSLEQVERLQPAARARCTLAPAGVDLDRFRPARDAHERQRGALGLALPDGEGPLVLSVRRLVARMGLPDLIEACARLAAQGQPLRLAIAGEGELREELAARLEGSGLGARARLLGRVPEERLPDLYRAADVFVLPTRALEGYGMVTAEALASGLPVVATRAGATAELLAGVEGAVLCAPGDPAGLAAALAPLLAEAGRRAHAARHPRAAAEARCDWSGHVAAVERAAAEACRA